MGPTAKPASRRGRVVALLLAANFLNVFDRALPAMLAEPVRLEFSLSDTQIGIVGSAFTIVYALAGLPLGRLADKHSPAWIIAGGLAVWSLFTGLTGLAGSFLMLVLVRVGVGVGEAALAPAANALIADLYPSDQRARATSLFMLGLPAGLIVAFFTTGFIVDAFGSWRAPFFLAMVPGLVLALVVLRVREPARGASDAGKAEPAPARPVRTVLAIPTMWCVIFAGIAFNFSAYAAGTFMVPNLQRYFGLSLTQAGLSMGLIAGISGLVALPVCGAIADRMHRASPRGRLGFGVICLALGSVLSFAAMLVPPGSAFAFVALFTLGWFFQYGFFPTVYPTIHDVLPASLRATGIAVFFLMFYLLGAAYGSIVLGLSSDYLAEQARLSAGAQEMTEAFRALGLQRSLFLIPVSLAITALFVALAAVRFPKDRRP